MPNSNNRPGFPERVLGWARDTGSPDNPGKGNVPISAGGYELFDVADGAQTSLFLCVEIAVGFARGLVFR